MGRKQEKAMYERILGLITQMQQPQNNKAQNFLDDQAIEGANYIKKGDFSARPSNAFFDFQMPGEELTRYKNMSAAGNEGTYALGDTGGAGKAMGLANQFLTDKFSRDASNNYQNNISRMSGNITGALGQSAGAKTQNDATVLAALQGMMGKSPQGFNWGALVGSALQGGIKFGKFAI